MDRLFVKPRPEIVAPLVTYWLPMLTKVLLIAEFTRTASVGWGCTFFIWVYFLTR